MGKRNPKQQINQQSEQQTEITPDLLPLAGVRQSGESDAAVTACNDWLRMGSGRKISALFEKYQETRINTKGFELNTLYNWSRSFEWTERATAFDVTWEARKNAERQAELEYGLALDYERVRKLKRLADFLEGQIFERSAPDKVTGVQTYHNLWVPDVKVVGQGEDREAVEIERFNAALLREYRETLNDLAKEVGGRIQRSDVTSGGKAVPIAILKMDIDEL